MGMTYTRGVKMINRGVGSHECKESCETKSGGAQSWTKWKAPEASWRLLERSRAAQRKPEKTHMIATSSPAGRWAQVTYRRAPKPIKDWGIWDQHKSQREPPPRNSVRQKAIEQNSGEEKQGWIKLTGRPDGLHPRFGKMRCWGTSHWMVRCWRVIWLSMGLREGIRCPLNTQRACTPNSLRVNRTNREANSRTLVGAETESGSAAGILEWSARKVHTHLPSCQDLILWEWRSSGPQVQQESVVCVSGPW